MIRSFPMWEASLPALCLYVFQRRPFLLVEEESELVEVIAAASKSGYSFAKKRKPDC